ncbi:Glyceraldehyde-3-phosphate dehydrogenase 1 [Serratia liquefaciens]|nr:Glyceraldehyde-3-phosphate dehydrogenase 1 [Serratia liquefaciens]
MLAGALLHELHKANREAPYANLGADVQKLRQDPEAKARDSKQAFQRWPHAFRRELLLLSGRALARREFNKHEHQRQHHQYGADNQIGGNMVKILAWYDNEWGFSNRLVDLALMMEKA